MPRQHGLTNHQLNHVDVAVLRDEIDAYTHIKGSHLDHLPSSPAASLAGAPKPQRRTPPFPRAPPLPPFAPSPPGGGNRSGRRRSSSRVRARGGKGMGGGRKRGRIQRCHFKQGRENVWKHNLQRSLGSAGGEEA
ncbi:hypothetical protein GUJ93_ZPchr0002g25014 [Zizania palustris]|uniref:Uncharacterized protein n=1 Tax=Zizania palustris TaxID=103762 RepID=A0A8J5V3K4_ZIZPA|nr:hypothetical protein GUJ93_ZPchr0002g25014 [Zizania palustris]KAG8057093.1 hypothetical protein GUJ93_ZPchr0002g25014 [Zizania palustris]